MPTVQPGAKVLVSGANGYIAVWVVHTLLENGYKVRGTIRSEEKGNHLRKFFKVYGDKLELIVVPDITKEGAFDEAVKGVDAIEHTASPFHLNAEDPQELIDPAVRGTTGILQSALKHGTSVKRVVVTSSCAAVLQISPHPQTFSEKDWNEKAIQQVEELGPKASNVAKYQASKTLAEKGKPKLTAYRRILTAAIPTAAWKFWNKNKSSVNWDLVVLNPPFVFGPGIHEVAAPEFLNTSLLTWYNTVILGKSLESSATQGSSWIDVRDLANAHMKALQNEPAGGERIIVSTIGMANTLAHSFAVKLPCGYPNTARNPVHLLRYDVRKADRLLGIQYRSMEETTRDTLSNFEEKGWLAVVKVN